MDDANISKNFNCQGKGTDILKNSKPDLKFGFSRQKSNMSIQSSNASKNNQKTEFSRPKPKEMHFSKVPFLARKFNFSN